MDLAQYHISKRERDRITDLLTLTPAVKTILDVGSRDGLITLELAKRGASVTALDFERPQTKGVTCVAGDATELVFADRSFDLVFCAELLEHLAEFTAAAREISRVAGRYVTSSSACHTSRI